MPTDYDYKKAYIHGHGYNRKMVKRLQDSGVDCDLPPLGFADDTPEARYEFTQNEKDIVLNNPSGVIEVKSSSTYWEDGDPSSIRSNFSTLFVDTVSSYREKLIKPIAYILVSQHTDGVLVVPVTTQPLWEIKYNLYDKRQGIFDDFYVVEFQHLKTFDELVSHIMKQQLQTTTQ